MTFTNSDIEQLRDLADPSKPLDENIVAIANGVEALTIERISSESTVVALLAGIEHQLTRVADSTNKPSAVITAEQAIDRWPLRINTEKAIPYLVSLGIAVEQDPNT